MAQIAWEIWETQIIKAIRRMEKSIDSLRELLIYVRERNEKKVIEYQNRVFNKNEEKVLS